uniref:Uncharacterized protein n=1 Tax=Amphimedon queenslandica TaxID=400682 RepID=A0A1X7T936_AMPQE
KYLIQIYIASSVSISIVPGSMIQSVSNVTFVPESTVVMSEVISVPESVMQSTASPLGSPLNSSIKYSELF